MEIQKQETIKFIERFFRCMEQKGIRYCILRNAEEVREGNAHDIDMTVDSKFLEQAEELFLKESNQMGWQLHLKTGDTRDKTNIKSYHFFKCFEGQIAIAHIDVFPTFSWEGYELIDNANLISGIDDSTLYHTASKEVEAVTKLFVRLLHNGYVKSKYKDEIKSVFEEKSEQVDRLMRKFMSRDLCQLIITRVIGNEWMELEKNRNKIVSSIKRTAKSRKCSYWLYLLKKASRRPGIMVAFEGTDGSGKSTIIDGLREVVSNSFPEGMLDYYHWRPGFLMKEKKTADGKTAIVTEPHAKKPYGKVKSFAKFMFFNMDYVMGYLAKIRWQLSKGHLVVFDRYYYDYYMDKLRYRLNLSDRVLNAFQFMIPKPDITFLLIGDPLILYERKKEISVEEIQNQIERLLNNQDYFNNSVVIDVNMSIDKVIHDVAKKILECGTSRWC